MNRKSIVAAAICLGLAAGSYLFLNSDFDGDNLTVWDEVLTHGATPFSRDIPEDYYRKDEYRSYRDPMLTDFFLGLGLLSEQQNWKTLQSPTHKSGFFSP